MRRQRGIATVEFAIAAAVLVLVLFGVMEVSRMMLVRTLLEEGVRRGARLAAVCPLNDAAIGAAAAFTAGGGPGISPGLTAANFAVQYLDADGAVIGNPPGAFTSIRYVRVSVQGFSMPLLVPFVSLTFSPADVSSTLPAESLGVSATAVTAC